VIVWLNPLGGVSGDMLLGALLGLGAPLDAVRDAVAGTGLTGWRLRREEVDRSGLRATRAVVEIDEPGQPARPAGQLLEIVARARPEPVAALAVRAVRALAEVEAGLHGMPVDRVHLHELGGLDTVVDTVGVAAALHALDVTAPRCGPLPLGSGTVRAAHGLLPVPAPATAALLARMGAPVVPAAAPGETVTPTGAALLWAAGTRFGPVPPMRVHAVGYGAGGRDTPGVPNVLQALAGSPAGSPGDGGPGAVTETLVSLETNVDDVTGELLGHLVTRLLELGAADAWVSPVVMKKGRPAHTVHVLARPERAAACRRLLLAETGSLGVRQTRVRRLALPRRAAVVEVSGQPVRVKIGPYGAKPEHDDVARAARLLDLPLREVARRAAANLPGDGRDGPTGILGHPQPVRGRDVMDPDEVDDDVYEQLDGLDTLETDRPEDPLDQGYSPPEKPWAVDDWGVTSEEEREGESLDGRLAREVPDDWGDEDGDGIGDTSDTDGEPRDDEVGADRAGRLTESEDGAEGEDGYARDVGIDGAGASAEEAAVHVVDEDGDRR
jgi:pyridinium-3,5-bisthiocarboxylic acid mononucleotide nickel chelatase